MTDSGDDLHLPDQGLDEPVDRDDADRDDVDRDHAALIEFGFDADRAALLALVVDAADPVPVDLAPVVAALADDEVAEAAWMRWGDADLLGEPLDELVDRLAAHADPNAGVVWLRSRHLVHRSRTDEAVALLESRRADGNRLVLVELASIAADRSEPVVARQLLEAAGVDVEIDLDSAYDPRASDGGFGTELAEEIAPFAATRPRPMAGRNEPCPCGSGRKYKQCHLGNELHPIADRAGWLYVKLLRFLHVHSPNLPTEIADAIVESVTDDDLRAMMHESFLPVDLALFEGGVAAWFLDAKGSLLPTDEVELLGSWIAASRSVYEVASARPTAMDVIDLGTRERRTVVETLPEEPLDAGWNILARLVPVGDVYRAYGGFLPVNTDMIDSMLAAFAAGDLATVVIAIGQIFETAATHDEISDIFADSIDTTELTQLLTELADDE